MARVSRDATPPSFSFHYLADCLRWHSFRETAFNGLFFLYPEIHMRAITQCAWAGQRAHFVNIEMKEPNLRSITSPLRWRETLPQPKGKKQLALFFGVRES
jgi:hypothetical protein